MSDALSRIENEKDMEAIEFEVANKELPLHAYVSQGERVPRTAPEKTLLLKADLLIMPLIAMLYFVSYMDRNNLGNARIMGLEKTLHITAEQFYNCSALFFLGYILFMFPGNIALRFFQPQRLIGGAVVTFGALVVCMSAVKSYGGLLALRILVGCFQNLVQTVVLYTPYFYKRDEVATRGAMYYSFATLSGAFSGLIAYAVQKNLNGVAGRYDWQWLFVIEGSLAMGVGLLTILLLPPFPDQIKGKHWLFTEAEITLTKERARSYNTMDAKFDVKQIGAAFRDPKTWLFAINNIGITLVIASAGIFLPTFINAFGYSPVRSQLFSVIPYACAFVTLLSVAYLSDRFNRKFIPLICCLTIVFIGYIILLTVTSNHVRIFGACLIVLGAYPCVTIQVAWLGINTGGFTKRAVTWAFAEVCANALAIMGSKIYVDPPRYIEGHSIILAFLTLSMISVTSTYVWMRHCNIKKDRIEQEYRERGEVHPDANKSLEEVYDQHISFRYTL